MSWPINYTPPSTMRTPVLTGYDSASTGRLGNTAPVAVDITNGALLVEVVAGGGVATNVNINQVGGATFALGQTTMSGSLPVTIASNQTAIPVSGSFSVTGTTDNSAFTAGTSTGTPTMGFYHSTIDAVTDGRAAAVAITANRAQHSNLRNASGTEVGTASTPLQVSIANTGANATAVKVDGSAVTQPVSGTFWQATQPVSGTVTANAGTNLNTSALALESGGNLDDIDAALDASVIVQEATTSGTKGITAYGAVTTSKPTYTTAKSDALSLDTNGLLRVSLADTPANTNKFLVTPDSVALPANQSVNVSQINGVTPLMGNGTTGTGSQRVTIASDNTAFAVNATLSAETTKVIGVTRTADGSGNLLTSTTNALDVNLKTSSITLPVSLTSTTITGTVAVTESGTWNVGSSSATGSAVPANAFYEAGIAKTSLPTAASDGNLTGTMVDKFGRQVVLTNSIRDLVNPITQLTLTSTTTETSLIAAVASTFNDIVSLVVINTSATATQVDFRDSTAGTIRLSLYVPAGDTRGIALPTPLPQAAVNTAWTAKCGTSVASVIITGSYIANK